MTLERQYRPVENKLVKMKTWEDYASRGIAVWTWFRVLSVTADTATMQHDNAGELLETITVPLAVIAPPLGWESRYTIYCTPNHTAAVLSWFERGIVIRANQCIGDPAGSTFQPRDNSEVPHWKYPAITDVIMPEDCAKLFRVVSVIEEEINHYMNPDCPNLREMGRSKRTAAIKEMQANGWEVWYERYAHGFWKRRKEVIVHDWQ